MLIEIHIEDKGDRMRILQEICKLNENPIDVNIYECKDVTENMASPMDDKSNETLHHTNKLRDFAENWNSTELIDWIINLEDGRCTVYEEKLLSTFNEQQITGKSLKKMEANDLKEFGIAKFDHRKDLWMQIQNLIQSQVYKEQIEGQ